MRKNLLTAALVAVLGVAGLTVATSPVQAKPPAAPGNSDNVIGKPLPALTSDRPAGKMKGSKLKGLPPAPGSVSTLSQPACGTPSPGCFKYAGFRQSGMTAEGAAVRIPVTDPYRNSNDAHTLVEKAVQSADGTDVVEIGITKDPVVNSGSGAQAGNPHLFVASWTDGSFNGYNGGGYIPAVGCNPCAGANLTASIGGTLDVAVQYFDDGAGGITDGWWVAAGGNWAGAFPKTVWGSTYTTAGLVQVFGEVVSTVTSDPCSDGGNGKFSSDATSATASNFALVNGSAAAGWTASIQTDTTAYTATQVTGTSMRYGGPGRNSIGTATGATGSCAPATPGTPTASALNMWREICPDGSSTGCNSGAAVTSAPLNTCLVAPAGQFNNSQNTTGVQWKIFHTTACTGSSFTIPSNSQANLNSSWNGDQINGWYRTSTP